MLELILELDRSLLLFLNGLNSPAFDVIMLWLTGKWNWVPFYVVLFFMIIYKERTYHLIFTIIFIVIAITFADQLSNLFKWFFERYRPSKDPELAGMLHLVVNPKTGNLVLGGGLYGFFSAHAANTFAIATFLSDFFKNKKWSLLLFVWAAVVSYSRVYLGVHYPLDIIVGAVMGIIIGSSCYTLKAVITTHIDRKKRYKN